MNPVRTLCVMASLMAVALATNAGNGNGNGHRSKNSNSLNNIEDPSNWVTTSEIEQLPTLKEVTLRRLEDMSADEGATLLDKLYHLSQFNRIFKPDYMPEPSKIKGYIVGQNGEKIEFNMNNFVQTVKRQPNFGDDEVTIFIQGMPESWSQANKANRKLVQAYQQRYNLQPYPGQQDSSEEQTQQKRKQNQDQDDNTTGDLVVIALGDIIDDFEQFATLNVERIGELIGSRLVQLTNEVNVPQEVIHLIGQGPAAHVAGVAGRQYTRQTGHKLRRITGLDPSKQYAQPDNKLSGLSRGDADFVDAIHTSAYGMGVQKRLADVDFYPNGPAAGVPGADNVVEASMRATRYFAESVRPGNERNFPAVAASSYKEYKQNNGYGKRAYMGIATNYDIRGDYMLQVNSKSPFGRNTPAQTQNGYHSVHESWRQQQRQQQQQKKNFA
ncbi:yolk protein 2 [Drosophila grimshawi]|uniref:Yolk protein 2 n=4 Tax=Drosophila grimshawi TaxID=7222 RepID=B4JIR7_DROGR|nr:yolk protein 2 [Drosophila grimshawi]